MRLTKRELPILDTRVALLNISETILKEAEDKKTEFAGLSLM